MEFLTNSPEETEKVGAALLSLVLPCPLINAYLLEGMAVG